MDTRVTKKKLGVFHDNGVRRRANQDSNREHYSLNPTTALYLHTVSHFPVKIVS